MLTFNEIRELIEGDVESTEKPTNRPKIKLQVREEWRRVEMNLKIPRKMEEIHTFLLHYRTSLLRKSLTFTLCFAILALSHKLGFFFSLPFTVKLSSD
jgi:hypothetical protein